MYSVGFFSFSSSVALILSEAEEQASLKSLFFSFAIQALYFPYFALYLNKHYGV
jgi:hypothetical protein